MNRSASANFRRLPLHVAISLALAAGAVGQAQAATVTFTGANGALWSATSSWAGGVVPVNGNDVVIGSSGAASKTASFASVISGAGLNSLSLDYGSTLNQSLASSAMIAKTESIGSTQAQTSTYNQSGGSNTTGRLFVGDQGAGAGVYNLSGGALNVGTAAVAGDVDIGWGGSTVGAFNQSAGTTTVLGQFRAGYNPQASGSVTLKGGSFNVSAQTTIGVFGSGSFSQSGGSATLSGLTLGYQGDSLGKGSYTLNSNDGAASLSSRWVDIGVGGGASSFTQSGNTTHQVAGRLLVGKAGSYALNDGTLSAGNLSITAGGDFTQTGGTLNLVNSADSIKAGNFVWTGGLLHFSGDASFADASLLARNTTLTGAMSLRVDGLLTQSDSSVLSLAGGQLQVGSANLSGQVIVGPGSTLASTTRLSNFGSLQLAGGGLGGAGLLFNVSELNGHGRIDGTGGFVNAGLLTQSGGDLILSNTGVNENRGSWNLLAGRQLTLSGAQLNNQGQLNLNGGFISGTAAVVNAAQGSISGSGRISAGFSNNGSLIVDAGRTQIDANFVNRGQVLLNSNAANLAGGQIDNRGLIQGFGKINNNVAQADSSGSIEAQGGTLTVAGQIVGSNRGILAAGDGGKLLISQGLASNAGQIQLSGGTLDNNGRALVNEVGGSINGFGTLRSGTLSNKGQILLSGGTSAVRADIVAQAGSEIILSGQSNTSFYGSVEVMSDAELRVSEGSVATFAGLVKQRTGSNINGDGKMFFEGGLNIGNSPGYGYIQGSVVFASSNFYEAEIGGTSACTAQSCALGSPLLDSSFDKLVVGGNLRMGGTLTLKSWNGFVAQAGQSFDLLDWGSSSGTFKTIDASGLSLAAGTKLDYSQLYTNGTITVTAVPEPETYALMLAGLGAIGFIARRRRAQAQA
ncbi:FxDxF family PEP-CTERM protein [Paucibacter sp. DJ1R-11]|uniref:beta strand repeat-containing protein n=1 Tax=Paucibacter sp. DJ1R-11 TaxID=2893556 RepID=UPI0021E498A1|nr:FxDxF family PEP-CTERM protein [Paucibacter sp. DJ1R-11]MCV2363296.1 FxDxF family PEP-CTERM protein [Paucibacter sp. DJ1R-11]